MFRSEGKSHWPWIVAFAAVYGALTLAVTSGYYLLIMTNVLVWAVMGLAWNLLSGYSGLISFGHAAFFGLGACFTMLAQAAWGLTPWLGIPAAGVLGALAGALVGLPTFRLRSHYFALAMLAYPLALLHVFEWLGIQEVAMPREIDSPAAMMQFDDRRIYVLIALVVVVAVLALSRRLERGRYGMSLLAIRHDETAAEAAGIDPIAWKLKAIALSGAISSAIGGFYAVVQLVVTPSSVFGVLVSAQALIVAMFGGVGTPWGPLIGAVTLEPLSAWLDAVLAERLPGIQGVVYGLAIVGVILLARRGVFWHVRDVVLRRRPAVESEPPDFVAGSGLDVFRVQASGSAQQTILRIDGLTKSFGGLRAVDDVAIDVRRGEILGMIGPNGAGKTTLFDLLNGFIRPDSGTVRFNGMDITGLRPSSVCRLGVGRTFQVAKPFTPMSIADNVVIGAYARTDSNAAAQQLAIDAMDAVGLLDVATTIAGSATNEQLRLMELARALASKPALLLLDEIFSGLSATEAQNVMAVIRRLAGLGITIVIVERTIRAMAQLVDRFVVLDHGAVLAEGPPDVVTRNPAVVAAYRGRKWLENA